MKKLLFLTALAAVLTFAGAFGAEVTRLRTEYQTTPIALEVKTPRLSWQMVSDTYGATQTAYRIVAANNEQDLAAGRYVYDSGKVMSDKSVSIPYGGAVRPATRYYWKVHVWNERNREVVSAPSWFETGLMDTGWSGAQWIGSNEVLLSRYRLAYVIDYDVRVLNDEAVFVFSAKDESNYVAVILNTADNKLSFRTAFDSQTLDGPSVDVSSIIGNSPKDAIHHVKLDVTSGGEGVNYRVGVWLDGKEVKDPDAPAPRGFGMGGGGHGGFGSGSTVTRFTVNTPVTAADPHQNRNTDRLDYIGYFQPAGQRAEFYNIAVSESVWGTTFTSWNEAIAAEGFRIWDPVNASAPMLRKTVNITKSVRDARLYAAVRGIYEFEVNGQKVSDDYYNPGWPDYQTRIYYNTFDVTNLLTQGRNGLGVTLGAGWWNDFVGMGMDPYGVAQSIMAKMVVEYTDGTRETFITDGSWRVYDDGPTIINGMQTGQEYDARKEVPGWSSAAFNDASWKPVKIFDSPKSNIRIQSYIGETIKNNITLTAVEMTEPRPGVYVYDMGVNMVGIPQLTNLRGSAGQKIEMHFAEMLWPEVMPENPTPPYTLEDYRNNKGMLYNDPFKSALNCDTYFMKGDAAGETFEPTLAQHGYRYVEITGLSAPLPLEDVKGLVLESIGEQLSWYETSDELTNQLFENIVWGQRGNFLSVPTDCPQRSERMGWTGDAQIFVLTSTYNMMTDGFWTRWMVALRDTQGDDGSYPHVAPALSKGGSAMGWMDAGTINPWQIYQQYADVSILEEHYESVTRYMDFLEKRAVDFILPAGGFGDWVALVATDTRLTNTAYWAYDAILMEKIARVLGKEEDAAKYAQLYQNIKKAWNAMFVDADGYTRLPEPQVATGAGGFRGPVVVDPVDPHRVNTQTSYVVPLYADLFNEQNKPLAVKHLVEVLEANDYKLNTGFIGTPYLCLVLSENGYSDVAYKLFQQTEYPSWLFPVLQGATTMWERWNSYTVKEGFGPVGMNSFNHYAYGAVEEWMMQHSLGIKRDETNPGYKHFYLEPEVGGTFGFVKGGFESIYGKIDSGWEKSGNGYVYKCTVPANTTATLTLVANSASDVTVRTGHQGATRTSAANGKVVYELKSGTYEFAVR